MFEPGHLHRSNPPGLGGQPGYSIDFYYEVRKDSQEGPMLHGRLVGEIEGRAFEEVFELHRDTGSVALRRRSRVVYNDYVLLTRDGRFPAEREDYDFTCGTLSNGSKEVEFRIEVDPAGGTTAVSVRSGRAEVENTRSSALASRRSMMSRP